MATTRIMPLHVGKGRTESRAISDIIDYVVNPQKTDNGRLITGFACDSRMVDAGFLLTKRQYIVATGRLQGRSTRQTAGRKAIPMTLRAMSLVPGMHTAIKYGDISVGNFCGTLQSHHGLQQKWASVNLSAYGYDPGLAPTITLETNAGGVKDLPHTLITNEQNAYNREYGSTSGDLQERLIMGAQQELNADISKDVVMQDLENNYKMIDKLNENNADKIRNGELDELVYSKDDIENSLVECGAAAESGKCS